VTMRQAVEAQALNPYCELGEHGAYGPSLQPHGELCSDDLYDL